MQANDEDRLYLTVLRGRADLTEPATPLLMSADPRVVAAAVHALLAIADEAPACPPELRRIVLRAAEGRGAAS